MNKSSHFLYLLLLSITFFIIPERIHAQTKKPTRPNIIYIYADDLGYGEIGPYGQKLITTPNLDRLAQEGMKFTQHYATAPVCAPSRCGLLTGKHSGHTYIRGNYERGGFTDATEGGQMPLPEGTFTIASMLKQSGYTTGIVGKWGLGMQNTTGDPNKQGFDYAYGYLDQKQAHNHYPTHLWENGKWDTLNNGPINIHTKLDSTTATAVDFKKFTGKDYASLKMTSKALSFIESAKAKPFFLYLAYPLPHLGLQAPDEFVAPYIGKFANDKPYYGQHGYNPVLHPRATYAGMITCMDTQIGLIMKKIKDLGLDDNTIILFSSDNGATRGAGGADTKFFESAAGLRGWKSEVFEGGIREPFIVRWPGKIAAGSTSDLVCAQFDMMATFAALSGAKPGQTDGISLLPTLLGKAGQQHHKFLYWEYPENGGQVAIRSGNWKGVRLDVKKNPEAPWMLYDLMHDPNEETDVASKHPNVVRQLNEIMRNEHQASHLNEWEFIDSKIPVH